MTNLRHSLEKRYSALTGELEVVRDNIARISREVEKLPTLEARIPELESIIESVTLVLKDACPDWQPEQTPAVKPWTHTLPVPFGSCGRRGLAVLRLADKPMSARQVAVQVLRECGTDEPDRETLKRTINAIEASFRKHNGRSVSHSGKYPMQWRSIANSDINFDV